jgi:hypothetical protein
MLLGELKYSWTNSIWAFLKVKISVQKLKRRKFPGICKNTD